MILTCIRAYSDKMPGDSVELDVEAPGKDGDGAYVSPPPWSELYLAEPDSAAAQRAVADRRSAGDGTAGTGPAETGKDGDAEAAKAAVEAAKAAAKEGA